MLQGPIRGWRNAVRVIGGGPVLQEEEAVAKLLLALPNLLVLSADRRPLFFQESVLHQVLTRPEELFRFELDPITLSPRLSRRHVHASYPHDFVGDHPAHRLMERSAKGPRIGVLPPGMDGVREQEGKSVVFGIDPQAATGEAGVPKGA